VYRLVEATPAFRDPGERISLVTSRAAVWPPRTAVQTSDACRSAPSSVRRLATGPLWPVLGGVHNLLRFATNEAPARHELIDWETRGSFGRDAGRDGLGFDAFAMPRVLGGLGGGTVHADTLVLTRDGPSVLEPAPVGGHRIFHRPPRDPTGGLERCKKSSAPPGGQLVVSPDTSGSLPASGPSSRSSGASGHRHLERRGAAGPRKARTRLALPASTAKDRKPRSSSRQCRCSGEASGSPTRGISVTAA
jgi:hypothetical protein